MASATWTRRVSSQVPGGTLAAVAFSFPLQIDRHTNIHELLQQRCVFLQTLGHFQDLKAWWLCREMSQAFAVVGNLTTLVGSWVGKLRKRYFCARPTGPFPRGI